MEIGEDVLQILKDGKIEEGKFYLPETQLDRSLYTKVDKVLKNACYKWNSKQKAHLPQEDNSQELLESAIQTNFIIDPKKDFQFFPTPSDVIEQMIEEIPFENGVRILEPSAGTGNIASAIRTHCDNYKLDYELDVCELNPACQQVLKSKGFNLVEGDFLSFAPERKYDIIVMNPPFSKQQDITHISHALTMLADDGFLVSVMSPAITFRTNKKTTQFKEMLEDFYNPTQYGYEIREVGAGAFKESGTNINTVILYMYP